MSQIIQIKRRLGGAPGGPLVGVLQAGELAFNNADNALYIGGDTGGSVVPLVHNQRQLEIHPTSPIQTVLGGAKTFGLANIKITGGNPGEFLSTTNADGTLAFAPMVAASQLFIGSIDAVAGSVTLVGGGAALPSPVGISGHYLITEVSGANPPAGVPDAGTQYDQGDWLISDGTNWTHLFFGGISTVTAADVGVAPAVAGASNVQDALEALDAASAGFVVGPATSTAGFIATYADTTGLLIATGIDPATLATTAYVDASQTTQDAAQDLVDGAQDGLITANAAAIALLQTSDAAQDTDILNKITKPVSVLAIGNIATYADLGGAAALDGGMSITDITDLIDLKQDITTAGDVKGQAAVIAAADNIAVYTGTNQKAIKDGGMTLASITASIALKQDAATAGDVKGPAGAIANNLAAFDLATGKLIKDSGQSITSIQTYVDTAINNIPGATPPDVLEPDLTGDGTAATPITWTGVKFVVPTPPELSPFTGLGTTASPLALVGIDGGTF